MAKRIVRVWTPPVVIAGEPGRYIVVCDARNGGVRYFRNHHGRNGKRTYSGQWSADVNDAYVFTDPDLAHIAADWCRDGCTITNIHPVYGTWQSHRDDYRKTARVIALGDV